MSDGLVTISLLVVAGVICVVLLRIVAARRVQARDARLREHLDWVNPAPRSRGRSGVSRR
jgi:hypothetical protein